MTTDDIQQIINHAYPLIQKYYGKGKLDYPKIDTSHNNTYAMHSGEPEAEGEHAASSIAEYYKGTIYLYLPVLLAQMKGFIFGANEIWFMAQMKYGLWRK